LFVEAVVYNETVYSSR